jgi:glutamyl-tRNA reductase
VLVIGAGKMGALAAKALVQAGAGQVDICNRSVERAQALAAELGGKAHGFEALAQLLEEADIVISSTGAAGFVVKAELVREVVVRRKYRPLFLIDIAVPRDIDPACDQLQNVYVFDIDDLEKVVDANLSTRRAEAIAGERIVSEEVAQMERWFAEHSVVPTIVELRNHFNATKEAEVERLLRAHPSLPAEQRELLHRFGNQLIAKLLHGPTVALRSSTASASDQQLMMATSRLFGLHDPGDAQQAGAANEGEQEG